MDSKETTQTTEAVLSPEARMTLLSELDQLMNRLGPEQRDVQMALLDVLSPQEGSLLQQNTLRTLDLGDGALETSTQDAGLNPASIAAIMDALPTMQPQAVDALRALAQQYGGSINTQVDPRFNFALQPHTETTTDDGGAGAAQAGMAAAGIAASIGLAM